MKDLGKKIGLIRHTNNFPRDMRVASFDFFTLFRTMKMRIDFREVKYDEYSPADTWVFYLTIKTQ